MAKNKGTQRKYLAGARRGITRTIQVTIGAQQCKIKAREISFGIKGLANLRERDKKGKTVLFPSHALNSTRNVIPPSSNYYFVYYINDTNYKGFSKFPKITEGFRKFSSKYCSKIVRSKDVSIVQQHLLTRDE